MLADLICLAWIIIFAYKCYKLEQETKDLRILQKINSRNIEYLCYLAPELKEGQLSYGEYIRKYYGGEEDE